MQSVFVNRENKAILTCPKCTKAKTVDVASMVMDKKKLNIRVKCSCGNIFPVVLERRKFYRKKTKLSGIFMLEQDHEDNIMIVTNLSRFGLEFKSSDTDKLRVGDRIGVEFRLDDKSRSLIKKKAIIRRIDGSYVGVEFCFQDEFDKVLGFYLFQ